MRIPMNLIMHSGIVLTQSGVAAQHRDTFNNLFPLDGVVVV